MKYFNGNAVMALPWLSNQSLELTVSIELNGSHCSLKYDNSVDCDILLEGSSYTEFIILEARAEGSKELSVNNSITDTEFFMETLADATTSSLVSLINNSVAELEIACC